MSFLAVGITLLLQVVGSTQIPYRAVVLAGDHDCVSGKVVISEPRLAETAFGSIEGAITHLQQRGLSNTALKVVFNQIRESCKYRVNAGGVAAPELELVALHAPAQERADLLLNVDLSKDVARFTLGAVDPDILAAPQRYVQDKLGKTCDRISQQCVKCNGKIVCRAPDPR